MAMPGKQTSVAVLEEENPYPKWSDLSSFSPQLRYFLKAFPKSFSYFGKYFPYNEIYATSEGRKIFLGAIPTEKTWKQFRGSTIRFCMLSAEEDRTRYYKDEADEVIHFPTLDHSIIDQTTGQNITYEKFKQTMIKLKSRADTEKKDIYFHCMAGKSRSLMALTGYLYLNEISIIDGFPGNPLPSNIAPFIQRIRPQANDFLKLDGHQKGFLGLLVLHKTLEDFFYEKKVNLPVKFKDGKIIKVESSELKEVLIDDSVEIAKHIGLILQLPLDRCFRDKEDRKSEEDAFKEMHMLYSKMGQNLLEKMLIPFAGKNLGYEKNFAALSPSAKIHFAILAQNLLKSTHAIKPRLPSGFNEPFDCALAAIKYVEYLSAGDMVEFLRTFSDRLTQSDATHIFALAVGKAVYGTKADRYHADIQLAELYYLAKTRDFEDAAIGVIELNLPKLSYQEQFNFVMRLQRIEQKVNQKNPGLAQKIAIDIRLFAQKVSQNYSPRSGLMKFFDLFTSTQNLLTAEQTKQLTELSKPIALEIPSSAQYSGVKERKHEHHHHHHHHHHVANAPSDDAAVEPARKKSNTM